MDNRPSPRVGPAWCLHTIRHNFEVPVGEVPLARDRFPITAFHPSIVVAAVFSGKLVGAVHLNRLWREANRRYLTTSPLGIADTTASAAPVRFD